MAHDYTNLRKDYRKKRLLLKLNNFSFWRGII